VAFSIIWLANSGVDMKSKSEKPYKDIDADNYKKSIAQLEEVLKIDDTNEEVILPWQSYLLNKGIW
jgi:hypothetical protein